MNDIPRLQLIEIIAQYGPDLIDEPRRVEGLLKDLCGEYKREIKALMDAAHERVALDLRAAAGGGLPPELLAANLTRRLLDNLPMSEEMARWAVESWAAALGIVFKPAPLSPRVEPSKITAPLTRAVAPPVSSSQQRVQPTRPVTPPANPPPALPQQHSLILAPGVELIVVPVPAGNLFMGSKPTLDKNAEYNEQPQHSVYLDAFWIGKYPVTNLQYQAFVRATGHRNPGHWKNNTIPAGKDEHPVIYVSWDDAVAFCNWANVLTGGRAIRLPSEAEWEKAARGTDGRIYPWGNAVPDATLCNYNRNVGSTTPVGRYGTRAESPYGCADMAGNVWEWCGDWYADTYYHNSPHANPLGPASGSFRIIRGGSWHNSLRSARCADRLRFTPNTFDFDIGFRVVFPGDAH